MKKNKNKFFAALILSVSSIGAIQNANAGDPSFIKFALDQAHKQGFTECDKAVSSLYEYANGDDFYINTSTTGETKKDTLRMTAAYGKKGDTVFSDATIRKLGSKCYVEVSTTVKFEDPCAKSLSDNPSMKVDKESLGNIWTKNSGGVIGVFQPLGNSCVVTYIRSNIY